MEMSDKEGAILDTVFCLPSICVSDPEKSQNIIFTLEGRENIQNDAAQPVRALEQPQCLFQLKWTKCPWSTLGLIKG